MAGVTVGAAVIAAVAKDRCRRPNGGGQDQLVRGGEAAATRLYDKRYEPAYQRSCGPEESADLLIDHDDPSRPKLLPAALA